MMIKRSAILFVVLLLGSVSFLVYAARQTASTNAAQPARVKCSGRCKKATPPAHWHIASPTSFYSES